MEKAIKGFKIDSKTSTLMQVLEMIFVRKSKASVIEYNLKVESFFEFMMIKDLYTDMFNILLERGINDMEQTNIILYNINSRDLKGKNRTLELDKITVEKINNFIEQNELTGQEFILMAFEYWIKHKQIDTQYLIQICNKVIND